MENLFIPYELAVKLKDKGFDEHCLAYYKLDGEFNLGGTYKNSEHGTSISAPLYQQVIDWFRVVHKYSIETYTQSIIFEAELAAGYHSVVFHLDIAIWQASKIVFDFNDGNTYDDYYVALTSAINAAIELI